jgi:hypothetical protein
MQIRIFENIYTMFFIVYAVICYFTIELDGTILLFYRRAVTIEVVIGFYNI